MNNGKKKHENESGCTNQTENANECGCGCEQKEHKAKEADQVETLKKENAELNDRLLRVMAEYDNFRKRSQREKEMVYPEAVAYTFARLLPVIDNIQHALAAPCADPEFKKGLQMIEGSLSDAMKALSVEAFGEPGEAFNPELHSAVAHDGDDSPDQKIKEVYQKGYKIGDKIIRHAMVVTTNEAGDEDNT